MSVAGTENQSLSLSCACCKSPPMICSLAPMANTIANMQYGTDVKLVIEEDGRVKAVVQGTKLSGYVNDGRLYIGDAEFYIERAGDGFNTVQTGDRSNKVHYTRK
jgi:hypothetical protein